MGRVSTTTCFFHRYCHCYYYYPQAAGSVVGHPGVEVGGVAVACRQLFVWVLCGSVGVSPRDAEDVAKCKWPRTEMKDTPKLILALKFSTFFPDCKARDFVLSKATLRRLHKDIVKIHCFQSVTRHHACKHFLMCVTANVRGTWPVQGLA